MSQPSDMPSQPNIESQLMSATGSHQIARLTSPGAPLLPDDVLLHIFLFDGLEYRHPTSCILLNELEYADRAWRLPWTWHRLTHVCRRWRSIIFASPNFLDLRLVCLARTRVELTSIWPPLPIIITNAVGGGMPGDYDFDAAMVHPNRVREITLFHLTVSQLRRLATRMQEQFPALMHLVLGGKSDPALALPDGFLGGSAPRLQFLGLNSVAFPALPEFLMSATDLVYLSLVRIPHFGFISPEAIIAGLAVMVNLETVIIGFQSPLSRPERERRRPPPPTRTVLPALTHFQCQGVSEYLEDLVARIDTPRLDSIKINFFHQLIFEIPQFAQFMKRTTRFQALNEAHASFGKSGIRVGYSWLPIPESSSLGISCRELDWQLSSLAQVLTKFFPSIHQVERLYMYDTPYSRPQWQDDIENMQWLEILEPFTAVKNLYLSRRLAPYIVPALQELVESRMTEVFSTLQNIFLEGYQPSGPILEGIGRFVAARQLSGHPITVFPWKRPRWDLEED